MRDALVRERDGRIDELETRVARAVDDVAQAERVRLDTTAESEQLRAEVERLRAESDQLRAEVTASTPTPGDGDRVAELERDLQDLQEQLEQSQQRLRRAYADAENARAQLETANPRVGLTADEAAVEEIQRLRVELGQAIERASVAENRASQLQADLAEARSIGGVPDPGHGDAEPATREDDDRSLRFRLARSAARKKGLGDEEMWS
jgi:chromosome segregation ATPase